ncbi:sulfite oxidase-like oxidoreductase [Pimelobacter simplex]|uniref:sulfite oxidase-like oxidoreductase n=1 Tax=Nocardioides simplex TaxID=2045 RepID=UPI00193347C2|nr:sulfite oxidase-like oxidoreductase [Pimelobacter simplex]
MVNVTRGFRSRRFATDDRLPPGQYLTDGFPVLSAGPTPAVPQDEWSFMVRNGGQVLRSWAWDEFMALDAQDITVDIHCVTRWSRLDTTWRGVAVDDLLADVDTAAEYVLARSYGGYTTNLPLEDLLDGKAWIAYEHDGEDLPPEHGGPARLLIPHLYLWKSAKWIKSLDLVEDDDPGFWETLGYHDYGDPWREQRYQGD